MLGGFLATRMLPFTSLTFLVAQADSTKSEYPGWNTEDHYPLIGPDAMVGRTNWALGQIGNPDYIGWIADDNRFETPGWDEQVVKFLRKKAGGVVYGNDVVSPGSKPSHVFMDARIPRALGWFLHPELRSTFFDDCWMTIGKELGTLQYLPDVVIEHRYVEKDNRDDFSHDKAVYEHWIRHDLESDISKIRRSLRTKRATLPASLTARAT